ncbi:hypothetical protein SCP_0306410 [Sparassis crispa]|uniref:CFEM domain-containing protein n=1 Tax=Sparassis crispa TaxID=139825 RepID=A0A401GFH9_9APHY|nr:hypothetical protein SCP_0306410 [Sparassis crispa]GBE80919.1 hypothetical protein SCP_0306410 [Sparassis crispa]
MRAVHNPRWVPLLVLWSWASSTRRDGRPIVLGLGVEAQPSGPPQCAATCAVEAATATGCEGLDFACACASPSFLSSAQLCMSNECNSADAQTEMQILDATCSGASTSSPIPTSSSASSAPPSSTASGNSSSSLPTSGPPSGSVPPPSDSGSATSPGTSSPASASASTTAAPSSGSSASASGSAPSSPSPGSSGSASSSASPASTATPSSPPSSSARASTLTVPGTTSNPLSASTSSSRRPTSTAVVTVTRSSGGARVFASVGSSLVATLAGVLAALLHV